MPTNNTMHEEGGASDSASKYSSKVTKYTVVSWRQAVWWKNPRWRVADASPPWLPKITAKS